MLLGGIIWIVSPYRMLAERGVCPGIEHVQEVSPSGKERSTLQVEWTQAENGCASS